MNYLFWIRSSRGTHEMAVHRDISPDDVKDYLEDWCSQFGAWHVSENMVHYGHHRIPKGRLEFFERIVLLHNYLRRCGATRAHLIAKELNLHPSVVRNTLRSGFFTQDDNRAWRNS